MAEVGRWAPRGVFGGEPGVWNERLFLRYRSACASGHATRARALLNELIRINSPLIKLLVGQLRGDDSSGKGRSNRSRMRIIGSEAMEWEEAFSVGRIAFAKAMAPGAFDPTKGKIAGYLKWKIVHELQVLVGGAGVVTVKRGEKMAACEYIEDDDHLARMTEEAEDVDDEPPRDVEDALLEQLDARALEQALAAPKPEPLADTRTALEVFFDEHVTLARHARCAASSLHGRFRSVASSRGEVATRPMLVRALRERGVRTTSVRVAWSTKPVWGFSGVSLQPSARTISLQRNAHGSKHESAGFTLTPTFPGGGNHEQRIPEASPAHAPLAAE